jgi:hypothetical protein
MAEVQFLAGATGWLWANPVYQGTALRSEVARILRLPLNSIKFKSQE